MRGHGASGDLHIEWKDLIAFKRTFTDPVPSRREEHFAKQGIDAFHGFARFTGPIASRWVNTLAEAVIS